MPATRTPLKPGSKPFYLNIEIDLELRRRFGAVARRQGETMAELLDRVLRREVQRLESRDLSQDRAAS